MEWVLSHLEDPNLNEPLTSKGDAKGFTPDAASLEMLTGMGFTARQATGALKACQGSMERAADWLFSRVDGLDAAVDAALGDAVTSDTTSSNVQLLDGPGEYELFGFISHIGANTACGHYVCHLKKVGPA